MKITMGAVGLIFVGIFGWFVGSRLSPDAVGMAVGVIISRNPRGTARINLTSADGSLSRNAHQFTT